MAELWTRSDVRLPHGGASHVVSSPRFAQEMSRRDRAAVADKHRVEVVRLALYCQPSFTYLLTITIK